MYGCQNDCHLSFCKNRASLPTSDKLSDRFLAAACSISYMVEGISYIGG